MAVTKDASSTSTALVAANPTLTLSHTCTGSNLVLIVYVCVVSPQTTSTVTYNSVSMTKFQTQAGGVSRETTLWGLIAPATGANNIVATLNANGTVAGMLGESYAGVSQSGLPDSSATSFSNDAASTTASVLTTTVANNCVLVGAGTAGTGNTITSVTGTFIRQTGPGPSDPASMENSGPLSALTPAGLYSIAMNYSANKSQMVVASLAPVAGVAGAAALATFRSLLGVGI